MPNTIVRAGAGAGKTYTLTHEVLDFTLKFLNENKRLPRIVVTTFTRKATQELRERLMTLALAEYPTLIDFVTSPSHLFVSTIHGVLDIFLHRYGRQGGIDPGFVILDAQEATRLARQTLRKLLFSDPNLESSLELLPFNQMTEIFRSLARTRQVHPNTRAYELADFEQAFRHIARDLSTELTRLAEDVRVESTAKDWLAMADNFLELANLLAKEPWQEQRQQFIAVLQNMKAGRNNAKNPPVSEETSRACKLVRERLKEFINEDSSEMFSPEAWETVANGLATLDGMAKSFQSAFGLAKKRLGGLEISDLESEAIEFCRNYPEAVMSFNGEWDYWLVDEFQDTSPAQVEILRYLVGDRPQFIVGDPQQSIYLFRGARADLFKSLTEASPGVETEHRFLEINRRSRPELLSFFNLVFAPHAPDFLPMTSLPEIAVDVNREVATIYCGNTANSDEASEEDSESSYATDSDGAEKDEANAREMQVLVKQISAWLASGSEPSDIAVLGRTNLDLELAALALNEQGLPTHVHSSTGFYDRREICDALALLKFLNNPRDSGNLTELLRSPWFRVDDQDIVEVAQSRPPKVWEAWLRFASQKDVPAIATLKDHLLKTREKGLVCAFREALIAAGFIDLAELHDSSGRREANIWKLLSRLEAASRRPGFNPIDFILESERAMGIKDENAEGDAVAAIEPDRINLMTVHGAKGLEFRHVAIARMGKRPRLTSMLQFTFDEDRLLWSTRLPSAKTELNEANLAEVAWLARYRERERQEHLRVLYVALTRAIDSVHLSWTRVEKGSWADVLTSHPQLQLSVGTKNQERFSYRILDSDSEIHCEKIGTQRLSGEVRQKWHGQNPDSPVGSANTASQTISVTELIGHGVGKKSSETEHSEPSIGGVTNALQSAAKGTAVHRLMEILKYSSGPQVDFLIEKWFPEQKQSIRDAMDFVVELKEPPFLQVLESGEPEWGFTFREGEQIIEGQIDLWGRASNGEVWIIDYKSGQSDYREMAFKQLTVYARALKNSGLLAAQDRIRLAAIYPFSRQVFFN